MIEPHLHLRRKSDGVEVVTLERLAHRQPYSRKRDVNDYLPVRYIKSGRKGYIKLGHLEADFFVVGKLNADERWNPNPAKTFDGHRVEQASAAAAETLREQDIYKRRKHILKTTFSDLPESAITGPAKARLDEAIHMLLTAGAA